VKLRDYQRAHADAQHVHDYNVTKLEEANELVRRRAEDALASADRLKAARAALDDAEREAHTA
jgi:hypothetical protein